MYEKTSKNQCHSTGVFLRKSSSIYSYYDHSLKRPLVAVVAEARLHHLLRFDGCRVEWESARCVHRATRERRVVSLCKPPAHPSSASLSRVIPVPPASRPGFTAFRCAAPSHAPSASPRPVSYRPPPRGSPPDPQDARSGAPVPDIARLDGANHRWN